MQLLVLLGILLALSALVRLFLLEPAEPPTAAGAPVMGVGIFAVGALQQMPFGPGLLTNIVIIELLLIWVYIAAGLITSLVKGTSGRYVADIVGCFAIGTWVAGTVVLATLVDKLLPEWRPVAIILAVVALLIFLAYLPLILIRSRQIVRDPTGYRVTGRILLSTVSVQALVVVSHVVFPKAMPAWLSIEMIAFGALLYFVGLTLIVWRYLHQKGCRLTVDWDNTNCILHGAMSITGLAVVLAGVLPEAVTDGIWVWAAIALVIVEAIEAQRMRVRVKEFGWGRGIFTYDVSQWSRNFTFGMFYLFTLRMYTLRKSAGLPDVPILTDLHALVISWGQYVVLFFLIVEIALFLSENVRRRLGVRET